MEKKRIFLAVLLVLCIMASCIIIPGIFASADTLTGILVANTANRSDFDANPTRADYFNNYYIEGGNSTAWLWTTFSNNAAVFRFDLDDRATSFEPVFVGEDYVGTFKIYASKNQTDWYVVAEMTTEYVNGQVYNSTTGYSFGDASSSKETAGNAFSSLNAANIQTVLSGNATKTVYLKVGDIVSTAPDVWGSRIQLRYFGITYTYSDDPVSSDDTSTGVSSDTSSGSSSSDVSSGDVSSTPSEAPVVTYPDPYDDNQDYELQTEFRVAVEGQTFDEETDGFETYTEGDLAVGTPQGQISNGNRLLQGAESVEFEFEVDPDAVFIKLDGWEASPIDGIDGSMLFNIGLYSSEAEDYQSIADCGSENGALMPPNMTWNKFDNTWGRSANNEYIVTGGAINTETGKKIVKLKLTARFNNSYDGRLFYKSFLVQTVVPVGSDDSNVSSVSNSSANDDSDVENSSSDDVDSPDTGDTIPFVFLFIAFSSAACAVIVKLRKGYNK